MNETEMDRTGGTGAGRRPRRQMRRPPGGAARRPGAGRGPGARAAKEKCEFPKTPVLSAEVGFALALASADCALRLRSIQDPGAPA